MTEFVRELREARLLGILRGCPEGALECVVESVRLSGLRFLEVALNVGDAPGQIRRLRGMLPSSCTLGAGTVLSVDQARAAVEAGATFLVSPALVPEVQEWARANGIPTLPGAFTPTEILAAHRSGAAMVKLFPAKSAGGPAYVRELRGPFRDIPLLACGGVSPENARDYLDAGIDALAFGGSVFTTRRLADGDAEAVARSIRSLLPAD
jgi:2-dehydro-3-deoxyphosphogluconate aldolase/(4S)-4-hydroxy-2-oxoglutarate aldolase